MPRIKKEYRQKWAHRNSSKLLKTLYKALDADFHNIDTPARLALYHHLITNLVHSAVLDSLSVNKKEIGAKKQELIIKEVTENFNSLIKNLEGGISQAFEHGAAKATKSTPFFICSIKSVQGVANDGKTPC